MKQLFFTIGIFVGGLWLFSACSDEEGSVGEGLLGTEKVNVAYAKDPDISVTNIKDEESNLSNISTALLGTLNDEVFGKTRSGAAFQVRLSGAVSLKEPTIDSAKLFLAYKNHYGTDTSSTQTARVYLLADAIQYEKVYNAATEIASLIGDEVGVAAFNKELASDTLFLKSKVDSTKDSLINSVKQVDTILEHLVVDLDKQKVGQYILDGSEENFNSSTDFITYFKGLYVNTDDFSASQGAIYGFDVYNSYLKLYFKNHGELTSGKDTIYATTLKLPITDNSARFNKPDFSQPTTLFSNTEYIYLQGIHGSKAKIEMPELAAWKDSTRVSINDAKLVFKIAIDSIEAKKYPLPYRLELAVVNGEGEKTFLRYSSYSQSIPNGILDSEAYTYTFNIPEYLQNLVEGKDSFSHFELSTGTIEQRTTGNYAGDARNAAARVVLHNAGENKPTLKVTYTKY